MTADDHQAADEPGHLYLGRNGEDQNIQYEAADLTTHGVIVGMTG